MYDSLERRIGTTGGTIPTAYTYNGWGNQTSLSTTRDRHEWDTTTRTYDPVTGHCLRKTYADGKGLTYTYTPNGRPLRTTDARGTWTQNNYDANRRIASVTTSDSTGYAITRDALGRPTSILEDSGNVHAYTYTDHGAIGTETTRGATLTHTYDNANRPTGYLSSLGSSVSFTYDTAGRIASACLSNSNQRTLSVQYDYSSLGNLGYTITTPSGMPFHRQVLRHLQGGSKNRAGDSLRRF